MQKESNLRRQHKPSWQQARSAGKPAVS
jgi:hypothetical protein